MFHAVAFVWCYYPLYVLMSITWADECVVGRSQPNKWKENKKKKYTIKFNAIKILFQVEFILYVQCAVQP